MAFAAVVAMTFSASSSAPTPVYHLYQDSLGLSHLTLTVIFAVYAFSLLAGLLTVGSLSDYVGRRPVAFAALILNAAAMALFVTGGSAAMLIAARAVQGLATGAALPPSRRRSSTSTASAAPSSTASRPSSASASAVSARGCSSPSRRHRSSWCSRSYSSCRCCWPRWCC